MLDNFGLPKEYRPNPVTTTRDTERDDVYWNATRLRNALYFQYPVYKYCEKLILKHGLRSVIDVGCGVGRKLAWLNQRCDGIQIVGIDQENPISYCEKTYMFGSWYVDDFENPRTDIDNLTADLVICSDVIEHVSNPDFLLDYARNRCVQDGLIVLSTPDRVSLHGSDNITPSNPDHVREWSFDEFSKYLCSRGFTVEEHFNVGPVKLGLNKLALKRWIRAMRRRTRYRYNQVCLIRS